MGIHGSPGKWGIFLSWCANTQDAALPLGEILLAAHVLFDLHILRGEELRAGL